MPTSSDAVPPPMWQPSMYATRCVSVMPVDVTPQTKNGIARVQNSRRRASWRAPTGEAGRGRLGAAAAQEQQAADEGQPDDRPPTA